MHILSIKVPCLNLLLVCVCMAGGYSQGGGGGGGGVGPPLPPHLNEAVFTILQMASLTLVRHLSKSDMLVG